MASGENRVELTKSTEGERSVRYIPQSSSFIHLSPLSHHHLYEAPQQRHHHHHQLDNLNLVRVNNNFHFICTWAVFISLKRFFQYLQSLPKAIPPQQIPSVAFLYAGNKHVSSPQVQAGFLYKARTQNYSKHGGSSNKDSYPVSATMYPIYNRPSIPPENKHPVKYQQQIYAQKPQTPTKVTPFSPTNKIPGAWRAINHKPYYTKGSVYQQDVQKEYVRFVRIINCSAIASQYHFIVHKLVLNITPKNNTNKKKMNSFRSWIPHISSTCQQMHHHHNQSHIIIEIITKPIIEFRKNLLIDDYCKVESLIEFMLQFKAREINYNSKPGSCELWGG